jgi:hypothetical protein
MVAFRIWYADGSTVDGDGPAAWAAAPFTGVQYVWIDRGLVDGVQYGEQLGGADWYWLGPDGEFGAGTSSPERDTFVPYDGPEDAIVKTGLWIDNITEILAAYIAWVEALNG